jgi:UDP-N-acetylglucosamine 3-dehydrogenase
MANLRAGLAGLGMMGRNHARVLRNLEGVDFVGAVDAASDNSNSLTTEPCYESLDQLIDAGIDMCVVALPTEIHLEAGLQLAAAGVHTMLEKPLAMNGDECDQLVKAFDDAGLLACVGHIERFNPALQALRSRLEAGELGQIFQIATRRQGPFPARIKDVGVIKDLATHDIDLTAWITDSPYEMISAQVAHKAGRDHEDLVAATGLLGNGAIANHLVNWLSPVKERTTAITGERGCFIADTLKADLTFCANGSVTTVWDAVSTFRGVTEGDVIRYAIAKPEPLLVEHQAFRDGVLGTASNYVPIHEGRMSVIVADACIASAATGTTQYLTQK